MSIKDLLLEAGLNEDQVSSITKQIGKEFVTKEQYNKISGTKSEVEGKIADLEAQLSNKEQELTKLQGLKENYDSLTTEYNNYKNEVETKESNQVKSSKLRSQLKNDGFNEKMIPLLEKEFDLSTLEIEEGSIKGWEELSKGVKSQYGDFISQVTTTGAEPSTPPVNNSRTFTREEIQNMSEEQINANWESVSKALSNIN